MRTCVFLCLWWFVVVPKSVWEKKILQFFVDQTQEPEMFLTSVMTGGIKEEAV